MGLYNILTAELECPRCDTSALCDIEFKLGRLDLRTYQLGDTLIWAGGHGRKPLRRPAGGTARAEGYADCPFCQRDFWVQIEVREDRITTATPDRDRPGYIIG